VIRCNLKVSPETLSTSLSPFVCKLVPQLIRNHEMNFFGGISATFTKVRGTKSIWRTGSVNKKWVAVSKKIDPLPYVNVQWLTHFYRVSRVSGAKPLFIDDRNKIERDSAPSITFVIVSIKQIFFRERENTEIVIAPTTFSSILRLRDE
jgi:hypothetical protein